MSATKSKREKKRQLGQFLTPKEIASGIVAAISFKKNDIVLEPSMGDGSFIIPVIKKFVDFYEGGMDRRLSQVLLNNIVGIELDPELYAKCLSNIEAEFGALPARHHLYNADFFRCFRGDLPREFSGNHAIPVEYDYIIGNPPFGGTFDPEIEDELDSAFGFRGGHKIKKETYSFFLVKSHDLLRDGGRLTFICSDTFKTINTMKGLRLLLQESGEVSLQALDKFSEETNHPMVVISYRKGFPQKSIIIDGNALPIEDISLTANASWGTSAEYSKYFRGPLLGDYFVATSGMTIGKNELFVREIVNGIIEEPYAFEFFEDPITLEKERSRARLGKLSPRTVARISELERSHSTRRNVRVIPRRHHVRISLPNADYAYYNKALTESVYSAPTHVVYWKDGGDAVLTFKKNGNWYLHGVGGQKMFGREGLTWALIAGSFKMRYLPTGYVLDSGAPCAVLRDGVPRDELFFVLAWTLSPLCNLLLKKVINHTKNIQSKDFERLPYPHWVSHDKKSRIISVVKMVIKKAIDDGISAELREIVLELGGEFEAIGEIKNDHEIRKAEAKQLTFVS